MQILSPILLPFHFVDRVLWNIKKCLVLTKSRLFFLRLCFLVSHITNHWLINPKSQRLSPFSSKNFYSFLCLTFRSLTYSFVVNFCIWCEVKIQFFFVSGNTFVPALFCWRDYSFAHWIVLEPQLISFKTNFVSSCISRNMIRVLSIESGYLGVEWDFLVLR